jgi:thiamine-monophosphate kinase
MTGYFEACKEFKFKNGGGDVRQGPSLAIRVFGVGTLNGHRKIGRSGAVRGDRLVAIGDTGTFMATYLLANHNELSIIRDGKLSPTAEPTLKWPKPQLRAMTALASGGLVSAASDTSDGLLGAIGAIDNLARASNCGFELDLNDNLLPSVVLTASRHCAIDPWNIFFAWGDWAVAATIPAADFDRFKQVCEQERIQWRPLGVATAFARKISARRDGRIPEQIKALRNENFSSMGFNAGLKGHLDYIL